MRLARMLAIASALATGLAASVAHAGSVTTPFVITDTTTDGTIEITINGVNFGASETIAVFEFNGVPSGATTNCAALGFNALIDGQTTLGARTARLLTAGTNTVTLSNIPEGDFECRARVRFFQDQASFETNTASSGTGSNMEAFTIDVTPPTFVSSTRLSPAQEVTNLTTLTFLATFSEPVDLARGGGNFRVEADGAGNLNVDSIVISPMTGPSATYEVTVTGGDLVGLSDMVRLRTRRTSDITDEAGNALSGGRDADTIERYTLDQIAPTLAITTDADPSLGAIGPFTVTFTFSEAVTDFFENDITVVNGTLSNLSPTDAGTVFTATVTPTTGSDSQTVITITVADGAVIDTAGNAFAGPQSIDVTFNDVVLRTTRVIENFLARRAQAIIANDPDLANLLNDVTSGSNGEFASLTGELGGENTQVSFSTSLRQIARAREAGQTGEGDAQVATFNAPLVDESIGFDLWMRGAFTRVDAGGDDSASGLFYLGGGYRFSADFTAGLILQLDWTSEEDSAAGSSMHGFGWMAGPYVVWRPVDQLIIDARIAGGTSYNSVSPFGTYSDDVEGVRGLARVRATGDFEVGMFEIQPHVGLIYFYEQTESYTDSLGFAIPEVDVSLGQLTFGPRIAANLPTDEMGFSSSVHVSATGVWDFDPAETVNVVSGAETSSTDDLRARFGAGGAIRLRGGVSLSLEGYYDGVGAEGFEAYGGNATLRIPF